MNFSTALSTSEFSALTSAARLSNAATSAAHTLQASALAFYRNEIQSGLLASDIARSAAVLETFAIVGCLITSELCDRAFSIARPHARKFAHAALYWSVFAAVALAFACVRTWDMWLADSTEVVVAQARIAVHNLKRAQSALAAPYRQVYPLNNLLGVSLVKAARWAVELEQGLILRWATLLHHFGG